MAGPAGAWLAYIFMGFVTAGISVSDKQNILKAELKVFTSVYDW